MIPGAAGMSAGADMPATCNLSISGAYPEHPRSRNLKHWTLKPLPRTQDLFPKTFTPLRCVSDCRVPMPGLEPLPGCLMRTGGLKLHRHANHACLRHPNFHFLQNGTSSSPISGAGSGAVSGSRVGGAPPTVSAPAPGAAGLSMTMLSARISVRVCFFPSWSSHD